LAEKGEFQLAYELQIRGTQDRVKFRSPWAAALLPFVTLGIYHLVWWYKINCELRDYGRAKGRDLGQNPTNSVLALFPGAIIIVPALVTYYRGTQRIQGAARLAGKEPVNGWIALILYLLLSAGFWFYLQTSLNDIWRAEADPVPGGEAPPAPPERMPPPLAEEPQRTEPPRQEPPAPGPGSEPRRQEPPAPGSGS
jgi:Domain of unknown function (DUF4234)